MMRSRLLERLCMLTAVAVHAAAMAATAAVGADLDGFPGVQLDQARQVAPGVTIIVDPRINYVPNIGVIEGRDAVLVVDTGLGPKNGGQVMEYVRRLAGKRAIYLTTTHFHPEHSFGAQAFDAHATFTLNKAQAEELAEKGQPYLELFRGFGSQVAEALEGTVLVQPDEIYATQRTLDLGGRQVILRAMPAHTRGDQIVYIPESGVIFLGDLVEDRFFPIFPDADSRGAQWIEVTRQIEALKPKIVVPGHGAPGDISMVREVGKHLANVKRLVDAEVGKGSSQEQITRKLAPAIKGMHPDWDNAVFIPYEIAVFYSEATSKPVRLPDLQTELKTD